MRRLPTCSWVLATYARCWRRTRGAGNVRAVLATCARCWRRARGAGDVRAVLATCSRKADSVMVSVRGMIVSFTLDPTVQRRLVARSSRGPVDWRHSSGFGVRCRVEWRPVRGAAWAGSRRVASSGGASRRNDREPGRVAATRDQDPARPAARVFQPKRLLTMMLLGWNDRRMDLPGTRFPAATLDWRVCPSSRRGDSCVLEEILLLALVPPRPVADPAQQSSGDSCGRYRTEYEASDHALDVRLAGFVRGVYELGAAAPRRRATPPAARGLFRLRRGPRGWRPSGRPGRGSPPPAC
jgi:hypothetical protein